MYLDNAATTKIHPEVVEVMKNIPFVNYNSKYYDEANEVKELIDNSILNTSNLLGIEKEKLVYTSGATESNNYIIKGFYQRNKNSHFITSKREHKSVLEVFKYLEKLGADVDYVEQVSDVITFIDIEKYIKANTKFVSIMAVNNETGIINDVQGISKELRKRNIFFHTDAVQSLGKIDLDYTMFDFISFSSHKINGPKGIGLAIVNHDIEPLIHGSSQQNNNRAGTLPNELIIGFNKAIELAIKNITSNKKLVISNNKFLKDFLHEHLGDDVSYNFSKGVVDNILSIRIRGEVNQIFLMENKDVIKASTGSSCSIGEPSYVLKDHGFTDEEIQETIRLSLSLYENLK